MASVTEDDHRLAEQLARAAGALLTQLRVSKVVEGKALGALGDSVANAFLMGALRHLRPDDGILSEEEAEDLSRLDKSRVWIIDPLDGTREYSEGRADWAVHVALALDGDPVVGAVALPGDDLVLSTLSAPAHACSHAGAPRLLVSRTRPAAEAVWVASQLGGDLAPMGSAGAKAMAVVRGDGEIYLHTGGQYEWDSCAPVAVARASGLHVSRADGSALRYNAENPYLPDLLICRTEFAGPTIAAAETAPAAPAEA